MKNTEQQYIDTISSGNLKFKRVPQERRTYAVCMAAVKTNGLILEKIPDTMKDEALCLAAVKQNGEALQYTPDTLRTATMCGEAVKSNGHAIVYIPKNILTEDMCLQAVKNAGIYFLFVPETMLTEKICKAAVEPNGSVLCRIPEKYRTLEVCRIAMENDGDIYGYVPEQYKAELQPLYDRYLAEKAKEEAETEALRERIIGLSTIEKEYFRDLLMGNYPIYALSHEVDTVMDTIDGVGADFGILNGWLDTIHDHSKWEIDEATYLEEEKRGDYEDCWKEETR
jgi:hypothetical protein